MAFLRGRAGEALGQAEAGELLAQRRLLQDCKRALADEEGFVELDGPTHAHPFTAGEDFCLVHNGSLSNPNGIRRKLEPHGIHFDTDNDTEAACRYLEWRMREGDPLEAALQKGFEELDGFYTFLMGTPDKLALIRDPFACKPAVVAESDDYVAIASEFRSLAHLPGIKNARVFEPAPEEMYVWNA